MTIFTKIVGGLIDNSRINQVPLAEGWTPELAIDTYATDAEIEAMTAAQYEDLEAKVAAFLANDAAAA